MHIRSNSAPHNTHFLSVSFKDIPTRGVRIYIEGKLLLNIEFIYFLTLTTPAFNVCTLLPVFIF